MIYREKLILKFIWQSTGPRIVKVNLKKNKVRGIILPKVKTYCAVTIAECGVDGGRDSDQRSSRESQNWTGVPRRIWKTLQGRLNGRTVFSTNNAKALGHPKANK